MSGKVTDSRVARAVAGDRAALAALLELMGPPLRAALADCISPAWRGALDVDDVLQVSYLEAFLQIGAFKGQTIESLSPWLRQIAEHNLQDAIKALTASKRPDPRRQVAAPSGDESYMALYELLGATSTTPSRVAAAAEARVALAGALNALPRDYRTVLQLYELEGRSAADIAAALGRSEGAVFMLRARALEALRARLPSASQILGTR
ncbi:MAG: sigma-70 family RNA polymerase sigma factor [Phycisphaerae bacterium]